MHFLFEKSIFDPGNKLFTAKHRRRVFAIKDPDKIFILPKKMFPSSGMVRHLPN